MTSKQIVKFFNAQPLGKTWASEERNVGKTNMQTRHTASVDGGETISVLVNYDTTGKPYHTLITLPSGGEVNFGGRDFIGANFSNILNALYIEFLRNRWEAENPTVTTNSVKGKTQTQGAQRVTTEATN